MAGLLNPEGLIFLSLLLPLLLLYLIKPKPLRKTIPSLMFILKDQGKNKINKLFRNWMSDLLFLIHLLLLLALLFALAQPYINVPQSFYAQESVIVLDVSASMNEDFDEAIRLAKDAVSSQNTIILVKNTPETIAQDVPGGRAENLLDDLEPTHTASNLAGALGTVSANQETHVTIISDFLPSQGAADIQPYIDAIESTGALVTTHVLGAPRENAGIIDLRVRSETSSAWIRNYADAPRDLTLAIGGSTQSLTLAGRETREVTFNTPPGTTTLELTPQDDFMIDNTAYVSTPSENEMSMLVLTNERESFETSNLALALDIIESNFPITITLEYAEWPRVPTLNHDIYLFYRSDPELIIPGHMRAVRDEVRAGKAAIITQQESLSSIDFQGLMPVEETGETGGLSDVTAADGTGSLTADIDFGQVQSYEQVTTREGATPVATANDDPIITISNYGEGTILYYGYQEGQESFSTDNAYPIFWRRALDLMTDRPTLRSLNAQTGTTLSLTEDVRVETPRGPLTTNTLRLDNTGFYELPDRTIAANLLSDLESDLSRDPAISSGFEEEGEQEGEEEEDRVPLDLSRHLLIIGLIILALELLYIKFRGDL